MEGSEKKNMRTISVCNVATHLHSENRLHLKNRGSQGGGKTLGGCLRSPGRLTGCLVKRKSSNEGVHSYITVRVRYDLKRVNSYHHTIGEFTFAFPRQKGKPRGA